MLFAGSRASALGRELARQLGRPPGRCIVRRFPDGELQAVLEEPVDGAEVILVQSLLPPIGESFLELRLLADACLRAGARRLTAVVPYFAYARQDRRLNRNESLGGPLMARLVCEGCAKIVAVDMHADAAEGWFTAPLDHLTALAALAEALRPALDAQAVVVSPDLGGAKRAQRLAALLGLDFAVVRKIRRSGSEVSTHGVLGQVRGRPIIIVDDLISTGATIEAAAHALRAEKCADDLTVVTSHALLAGNAVERLAAAQIQRLIQTDSVPPMVGLPFAHQVVPLAALLASALLTREQA